MKAKLIKSDQVIVLPSRVPTTKYCPQCGKLKKEIKLSDRVYECECGYHEDRDIHAARNMILLTEQNTCGTQGKDTGMCPARTPVINAFGDKQHGHVLFGKTTQVARFLLQPH